MNARRSTIVLILRFVMNTESVNSRLDPRKMHDLDQRVKVEVIVHRDDQGQDRHLIDPVLVQEAGAMMVTEVLNYLLTALAMNARPNTIVLIPRFVMKMESANSHPDPRKMHDLDREVEVEVIAHRDDHHPVDLGLIPEAGAMTVTEVLNYPLTVLVMNVRRSTIVLIPRFVMKMESVNSHLDPQKTHDLDPEAGVEVIAHRDDQVRDRHLVVLVLIAMTVMEAQRKW